MKVCTFDKKLRYALNQESFFHKYEMKSKDRDELILQVSLHLDAEKTKLQSHIRRLYEYYCSLVVDEIPRNNINSSFFAQLYGRIQVYVIESNKINNDNEMKFLSFFNDIDDLSNLGHGIYSDLDMQIVLTNVLGVCGNVKENELSDKINSLDLAYLIEFVCVELKVIDPLTRILSDLLESYNKYKNSQIKLQNEIVLKDKKREYPVGIVCISEIENQSDSKVQILLQSNICNLNIKDVKYV